jgi:hypothetical protein
MTRMLPRTALYALTLLPAFGGAARAEEALPDAKAIEKMTVCTDGKSHYVAIAPDSLITSRLHYGDGKTFYAVPPGSGGAMSGDWFQDPRRFNKTNNSSFRGLDLRLFSRVEYEHEKKTCVVVCGDKKTELQIMEPQKAKALLSAAKFQPSPRKWAPYALARDTNGVYYYVDRGYAEADKGRFRLYVGPKGALVLQTMKNVVSDSEGDIFATKTGSLRLILDKSESSWIQNDKAKALRVVPVGDNLPMIYNELGVYGSERLGTPCDDF